MSTVRPAHRSLDEVTETTREALLPVLTLLFPLQAHTWDDAGTVGVEGLTAKGVVHLTSVVDAAERAVEVCRALEGEGVLFHLETGRAALVDAWRAADLVAVTCRLVYAAHVQGAPVPPNAPEALHGLVDVLRAALGGLGWEGAA